MPHPALENPDVRDLLRDTLREISKVHQPSAIQPANPTMIVEKMATRIQFYRDMLDTVLAGTLSSKLKDAGTPVVKRHGYNCVEGEVKILDHIVFVAVYILDGYGVEYSFQLWRKWSDYDENQMDKPVYSRTGVTNVLYVNNAVNDSQAEKLLSNMGRQVHDALHLDEHSLIHAMPKLRVPPEFIIENHNLSSLVELLATINMKKEQAMMVLVDKDLAIKVGDKWHLGLDEMRRMNDEELDALTLEINSVKLYS